MVRVPKASSTLRRGIALVWLVASCTSAVSIRQFDDVRLNTFCNGKTVRHKYSNTSRTIANWDLRTVMDILRMDFLLLVMHYSRTKLATTVQSSRYLAKAAKSPALINAADGD